MQVIQLTRGKFAKVDDEDYERIMSLGPWHATPQKYTFYAAKGKYIDNKHFIIYMHNVVMNVGKGVDHIDLDGLNNQKSNLRLATNSQQAANHRRNKNNTTGVKGVCINNGSFCARIKKDGKFVYTAYFRTLDEATTAIRKAREEIWGEFARHE